MLCECGLMYTEESRIEEGTCSLYTRVGVAHIKYYGLKCNMNKCEKKFCDVSGTFGMFFTPTQHVLGMKSDGISSMQSRPAKYPSLGSATR